jgi:transcriptional regulator with XRE-family HTH domain
MPNVDKVAKAWEMKLAGRVGDAIKARRNALKLTAVDLAERTKALGYPVNRVAISKIEGNLRAGKLDVAELFALAVALEIPPTLLLFPTFPDGAVDVLPRSGSVSTLKAREWICGDAPLPVAVDADGVSGQIARPNQGVGLVGAVVSRAPLDADIANFRRIGLSQEAAGDEVSAESTRRTIESLVEQLSSSERQIAEARAALWGTSAEDETNA